MKELDPKKVYNSYLAKCCKKHKITQQDSVILTALRQYCPLKIHIEYRADKNGNIRRGHISGGKVGYFSDYATAYCPTCGRKLAFSYLERNEYCRCGQHLSMEPEEGNELVNLDD